MINKDPWCTVNLAKQNQFPNQVIVEFEDNFEAYSNDPTKLPDSQEYLKLLEKKLNKLKSNTNILSELSARREVCLESLLRGSIELPTDLECGIVKDSKIISSETKKSELVRYIRPEQPLSVGELVHIIKFDQLQTTEAIGELSDESDCSNKETKLANTK